MRAALAAVALAAVSVGWLDPYAKARQAARLYTDGKYDDAVAKYNEALVDDPDSALLHFNMGDAQYKQGKFTDALNAFQQVPAGDEARTARVAYNAGNALYRLGEAAATSDPKAALGRWAEALAAYRRAMGADPLDVDAKFNHEMVEKKIAELKKKLEEQKKQQDEQKQQQKGEQDQNGQQQDQQKQGDQQDDQQQDQQQGQQNEQKQDQQQPDQQQAGKQKPDENTQDEQKPGQQQPQAGQQPSDQQEQGQADGAAAAGERKDGEMSRQEAAALLDAQRSDEVQPSDVTKRLQGAVVGDAAQDW
jgi:Ca-activated chloride channel homolog